MGGLERRGARLGGVWAKKKAKTACHPLCNKHSKDFFFRPRKCQMCLQMMTSECFDVFEARSRSHHQNLLDFCSPPQARMTFNAQNAELNATSEYGEFKVEENRVVIEFPEVPYEDGSPDFDDSDSDDSDDSVEDVEAKWAAMCAARVSSLESLSSQGPCVYSELYISFHKISADDRSPPEHVRFRTDVLRGLTRAMQSGVRFESIVFDELRGVEMDTSVFSEFMSTSATSASEFNIHGWLMISEDSDVPLLHAGMLALASRMRCLYFDLAVGSSGTAPAMSDGSVWFEALCSNPRLEVLALGESLHCDFDTAMTSVLAAAGVCPSLHTLHLRTEGSALPGWVVPLARVAVEQNPVLRTLVFQGIDDGLWDAGAPSPYEQACALTKEFYDLSVCISSYHEDNGEAHGARAVGPCAVSRALMGETFAFGNVRPALNPLTYALCTSLANVCASLPLATAAPEFPSEFAFVY